MPDALLLHGLSSSPADWWRARAWLEGAGWRVVAPSLLGHGGRPPAPRYTLEDYAADALAHPAPDGGDGGWDLVLGHSLGGTTATLAASADASWTRALVLLDPVWHVPAERAAGIRAEQLAELGLTRESLRAASPDADPRDVEAKLTGIAAVDPRAVGATFDDSPAWDAREAAARLAAPTLVLAGDPGVFTLLDPRDAGLVARANPRVEVRRVPGAGHGVHRDRPEAVRVALEDWIRRTGLLD